MLFIATPRNFNFYFPILNWLHYYQAWYFKDVKAISGFYFHFPNNNREKKNLPERWLTENPIVTSPVGKTKMSLSKIRTVTLRVIPNDFKRKSPLRKFFVCCLALSKFFCQKEPYILFWGRFISYKHTYVCTHDMPLRISQNSGKLL